MEKINLNWTWIKPIRDHIMDISSDQVCLSIYKDTESGTTFYTACGPRDTDCPFPDERNYFSLIALFEDVIKNTEDAYFFHGEDCCKEIYIELDRNYPEYMYMRQEVEALLEKYNEN